MQNKLILWNRLNGETLPEYYIILILLLTQYFGQWPLSRKTSLWHQPHSHCSVIASASIPPVTQYREPGDFLVPVLCARSSVQKVIHRFNSRHF